VNSASDRRTEVSTTIRNVKFAELLRTARQASGLTQAELGARAGVARPNIAAYEAGRRQPLFHSGIDLLDVAGAGLCVEPPVQWSWVGSLRPVAVPSRLWRLPVAKALGSFEPGISVWWSGPSRRFELAHRPDRLRTYEIVLREGGPSDIETVVDGLLLCEAWHDLVLPKRVIEGWTPVVGAVVGRRPAQAS